MFLVARHLCYYRGEHYIRTMFHTKDEMKLILLAAMRIAGNVLYAPESSLVKVPSSPCVYMVGGGGVLHWVQSADILVWSVGENWESTLDDIPESLLADYTIGDPINDMVSYQLALSVSTD